MHPLFDTRPGEPGATQKLDLVAQLAGKLDVEG